jgi:hypothetical protein
MKKPSSNEVSVEAGGLPVPASWRRVCRSPLLPSLALFFVSLAVALHEAMKGTDGHLIYSVDDAYIHMAVAKNLARSGLWGCTPFHFSSSSSSLLWTFVLGVAYRLFGVRDVVPLVLNVAFVVSTLVVANRSLTRLGVPPLLRAATLVGIVVAFPMTGMVLLGMEHPLHLLLTIAFAAAAVEALTIGPEDRRRARRRTMGLCLLGALLGASRYEGFFLVGLACLGFLARRQILRCLSVGVAACVPVVVFGVISVANGAFFLPNSLMLKASGESVSALHALLKPFGSEDLAFLSNNRALPILLVLGVLGALAQWYSRRDFWRPQALFPLLLASMIVAHGHYVFSPLYWVYRYDAYLVGFGIFVAGVLLAELRAGGAVARRFLPALLATLLVGIVANVPEGVFPSVEIAGMRNTWLEQYHTALFIRAYYPDAAVVVNDLGAVTYYTEANILDVVALGNVEPLEIMRRTGAYTSRDVLAWTSRSQPRVAIISLGWGYVVPLVPREWIKVAEVEVPPNRERVGFFAVDLKASWQLRASVSAHFGPLRAIPGYVLRLRSAERMYELAAGSSAVVR